MWFRRLKPGLVAPIVLGTIAVLQMFAARDGDLSRWKGGGFGMFSSVDGPPMRSISVYLLTDIGRVSVEVPAEMSSEFYRTRAYSTHGSLHGLAARMAARDYSQPYPIPGVDADDSVVTRGLVVEAWTPSLDTAGPVVLMNLHRADTVLYQGAPRWIYSEQTVAH